MGCFLRYEALPADVLTGSLAALGLPVPINVALPPPEDRSFADVWTALGGELKPSLDIVVTAPTDTGRSFPAGPAVQKPTALVAEGLADSVPRETVRRSAGRGAAAGDAKSSSAKLSPASASVSASNRTPSMDKPLDSTRYLLGRAMLVEERIRTLVAHRRGHDPAPDDPFRGLYLSDEVVDALLTATPPAPDAASERRDALERACRRRRGSRR